VTVGALNFEIAKQHVRGSFHVDDEDMGRTLATLLVRAKVLVEPSGAAALAIAMKRALPEAKRIGVLLSGGNVDPTVVSRLVDTYGSGS